MSYNLNKYYIYTIGYSAFPNVNDFISVLKDNKISCIIDVRSSPFSSFLPQYNTNQLNHILQKHNILYRNYIYEFGARQENPIYYHQEGYLDFTKFILSKQFLNGVAKVKKGIDIGYTFCLMCAEADPINCHRSIMLSRGFKNNGFEIAHVIKNGYLLSHKQLEENLINTYFVNHNQITIFDDINNISHKGATINKTIHEDALLISAYSQQNKLIGFRGYQN